MRRRPGNCSNLIKNLLAERSSINYEVPAFFGIFRPRKRTLGEEINYKEVHESAIFGHCVLPLAWTKRSMNFFNQLGIFSSYLQSISMTPWSFFQVFWSRQFGDVFFQPKKLLKSRNTYQTLSKEVVFMFFCSFVDRN